MTKRLDIILLICTLIALPFIIYRRGRDVLCIRMAVLGAAMLCLYFIYSIQNPDTSIIRRKVFLFSLCYMVTCAVSMFFATNISESLWEVLKTITFLSLFLVTSVMLCRDRNNVNYIVKAVLFISIATGSILLYKTVIALNISCGVDSVKILFANKNLASSATMMLLPFSVYSIAKYSKLWKVVGIVSLVLSLSVIILLQSRGVWLSIVMASVVLLFAKKTRWFLFGAVVVVICAGLFIQYSGHSAYYAKRAKSTFDMSSYTNNERVLLWKKCVNIIRCNPVIGVGAGNLRIVFPGYGIDNLPPTVGISRQMRRPHNDYLWVLAETGCIGFVFYMAILSAIICYTIRIYKYNPTLSMCMLFGFISYGSMAFFSYPKERVFHNVILMIMFAIVVSEFHRKVNSRDHSSWCNLQPIADIPRGWKIAIANMCICLMLVTSFIGVVRVRAKIYEGWIAKYRKQEQWDKVVIMVDKAHTVFSTLDYVGLPFQFQKMLAYYNLGYVNKALYYGYEALEDNPYHPILVMGIYDCLRETSQDKRAIQFYVESVKPIHPELPIIISDTRKKRG